MTSTTRCGFCGAVREPITVGLAGREVQVGLKPCRCPQAEAERMEEMRRADAEDAARTKREFESRAARAGIPERYLSANHGDADAMAASVLSGTGFYIDGPQGTGKTYLAMSIAAECIRKGASTTVTTSTALLEAMRTRGREDRDLTSKLAGCKVLVIDDLGKESPSPYACERLFEIVNDRYNACKPIIVTSNYSRGEIARKLSEGDVGRSIASRLSQMTMRVHIDGADRRIAHA
jgi:DNA replication protein DnaC